jgi:MFS family permease
MMPTYGKLGDVFGRKRVYLFAVVSFMFGSLLCGVATSMPMLIIARAIQGLGGGGLISLVMIIIAGNALR